MILLLGTIDYLCQTDSIPEQLEKLDKIPKMKTKQRNECIRKQLGLQGLKVLERRNVHTGSSECSGLTSFRLDCFDLLAV